MDHGDRESIRSVLVRRRGKAPIRLVLGLTTPSGEIVDVGRASFKCRAAYRKALLKRQRSIQKAYVEEVAKDMDRLGLRVRTLPLTKTIVVEGRASRLETALEDTRIESVAFDDDLTLIEPVKS